MLSVAFFTIAQGYDQEYLKQVTESHLSVYGVLPKEEPEDFSKLGFFERIKRETSGLEKALPLRQFRELAFTKCFPKSFTKKSVIDFQLVQKLELVRSEDTEHENSPYLVQILGKHTSSHTSTKKLVEFITQPDVGAVLARKRQQVIKSLMRETSLYAKARKCLNAELIKEGEEAILRFDIKDEFKETVLKTAHYFEIWGFKRFNKWPLVLGARGRSLQALRAFYATLPATGNLTLSLLPTSLFPGGKSAIAVVVNFYTTLSFIIGLRQQITENAQHRLMQRTMIHISRYIKAAKDLYATLMRDQTLHANLGGLQELAELVQPSGKKSNAFYQLINLLERQTFQNEASFFSSLGNILTAYHLMTECKDEFTPLIEAVGEIDAYVSIATLMKESKQSKAPWCFAEFVDAKYPVIKATGFWNPFIPKKSAVANDVQLGGGDAHGIMLTGPNTGGKSTTIKALIINALMAQTFGIAAAQSFAMTPFAFLSSYLNITDNTGSGISLFKAEVLRAKELVEMIKGLREDQFAFLIMDEIFSGTNPKDAEETSYQFVEGMCRYPNCLFINATHFPKLTTLEDQGLAANYHMGAITDRDGKVTQYTYKLEKGASTVSSAQQVAEEQGALWN